MRAKWLVSVGASQILPQGGHVFRDTAMLRHAAIQGHGIALFAMELVTDAIAAGDLVAPFPNMFLPTNNAYYLITRSRRLSAAAGSFIRWVKAVAGASGAGL
ncbi:LysR substrate-binding domain-containing protein [Rhizobium sp. F40D2]|uniref:LysR substrate-binding domain-containing protein n=1 Tax=Rhizobium sp. F40D2 TaxID=3453141 RepID=UPI003F252001